MPPLIERQHVQFFPDDLDAHVISPGVEMLLYTSGNRVLVTPSYKCGHAARRHRARRLGPQLIDWSSSNVRSATETSAGSRLAVVATPVYKATYTGLLKLFLDWFGPTGLSGVAVVPVMVGASPTHAVAVEVHVRPLIAEIGATVPTRGLVRPRTGAGRPWGCHHHVAGTGRPGAGPDTAQLRMAPWSPGPSPRSPSAKDLSVKRLQEVIPPIFQRG